MRIAFITGSLEFGRDGVGDYTKSLINQLRDFGHSCCAIALNDRWCGKDQSAIYDVDGSMFYRLSSEIPWQIRIGESEDFLNEFQPDYISLQFVGYAYHTRAFVYGLAARMKPLIKSRGLHLMLHELWIGEAMKYGLKDRFIGHIQKRAILKMIRELQPDVIHTTNMVYQLLLQRNGVHADILPLFGSIPVIENPDSQYLFKTLNENGVKIDTDNRNDFILFGIFGTIHPQWNPAILLSQLLKGSEDLNKRMVFISIGRVGARGEKLWDDMVDSYSSHFNFIKLGEQSDSCISHCLQTFDMGIATSPWSLREKSSTVAAMLDHGLPVVVTRDDWSLRHGMTPEPLSHPLLYRFDDEFITQLKNGIPRAKPQNRRLEIAAEFIKSLEKTLGLH